MYETVTLQSWTTTQCLLDWCSTEDHYKTYHCILVEREETCMLHTFIDYLAFQYTPPLCEVGTQVDRSQVPDTRFAGISSSNILIGQCTRNYVCINFIHMAASSG